MVYDQRQNGSTNYRVHLDGLIVAVLPADALTPLIGGGNNTTDHLQRLEELLGGGEDSDDEKEQLDAASASTSGEQAATPAKPK